jgi:hypothetical protein
VNATKIWYLHRSEGVNPKPRWFSGEEKVRNGWWKKKIYGMDNFFICGINKEKGRRKKELYMRKTSSLLVCLCL